jgi:hypothetical protein
MNIRWTAAMAAAGWLWVTLPQAAFAQAVTFSRDVAPILHKKCVSCHRAGEVAPMSLLTYQDARPWSRAIKEKVTSRQMPPWFADSATGHFANDPRLTDQEIATLSRWTDAGAPQGDPKDLPPPPKFTEGWQLGQPDFIVELPEITIPATGEDYFPTPTINIGLKEDHWIRAIEIRPGNRQVTHHSVIFSTAGNPLVDGGLVDVLGVWAVGTPPAVYPEGQGRWIRKGQTLRTNLHYHPNGTPQTDRTRIGLYFGSGELKKEVSAGLIGNILFTIPPNAPNHELRSTYVIDQDVTLVSFFPHMHMRGKDMTFVASFPGGRQDTLLSVPAYDFNWQLYYYPKTPLSLPRGTRIDLIAHYDNSPANKRNPDPSATIRFGEASTTSEMMFGMFEFTTKNGVSPVRTTVQSRFDALFMSFAPASALMVKVPFGAGDPTTLVFHVPRSGDARTYLVPSANGRLGSSVIQELTWQGNAFRFNAALLGPGAGAYTVTGTVADDGSVVGEMRRRGNQQPPMYPFTGTINR